MARSSPVGPTVDRSGDTVVSRVFTPGAFTDRSRSFVQPNVGTVIDAPLPEIASRDVLASSATMAGPRQQTVAGDGSVVYVTYGRDRVGGQFAGCEIVGSIMYVLVVWGWGPISGVSNVRMNDAALPSNVTATHYLGTDSQTVNSTLVAACAANGKVFADRMLKKAYSLFGVPAGASSGFPTFTAQLDGRLVASSSGGTPAWSDVPAHAIAEYVENTDYGMVRSIDWDTVAAVATLNSAMIGTPAERRRTLNLTMMRVLPVETWLTTLCAYAGCQWVESAGVITLLPNAPSDSVMTFDMGNIVAGSFHWRKRGRRNVPTIVRIAYTDTSQIPYRDDYATYPDPDSIPLAGDRIVSQVPMPGINRYSQANREAIEQYKTQTNSDFSAQWQGFDEAAPLKKGDVVTVTHAVGLVAKQLRLSDDAKATSPGRYLLQGNEYDPSSYSELVATKPSAPDSPFPSETEPPAVTGLAVSEEQYQLVDGTWQTRIRAGWIAPAYPYVDHYRVEVTAAGQLIQSGTLYPVDDPVWRSQPLLEQVAYLVNVYVVTRRTASAATSASITLLGQYAAPADVGFLSAFEAGGKVYARWPAVSRADRYELRYGVTAGSWDTATVIDRRDALSDILEGLPAGEWRFYVKAINSVGRYSANAATCDVTISLDNDAFISALHTFAVGTLTNMTAWRARPDPRQFWTTDFGDPVGYGHDDPDDTTGTFGDSLENTVITEPHTPGDSAWESDVWDRGAPATGTWMLSIDYVEHAPTATPKIMLSTDGVAWTTYYGTSAKGTARYVKCGLDIAAGSATLRGAPSMTLAQSLRTERFLPVITDATDKTLVRLAGRYGRANALTPAVIDGAANLAIADRILVATEDGLKLAFDLSGSGSVLQSLSRASRTIVSGDHLEFDLWLPPETADLAATITMRVRYTDTSTRDVSATWISGQWVAAAGDLAADVGKTIDYVMLRVVSTVAGEHAVLVRNVRITDGGGTDRQVYWDDGEPDDNSTFSSSSATSINMGPANSFLVWTLDAATLAQVAGRMSVVFEGA